ncbi:MAG TPA: LysR substrate-binding domain-containing protein [Chroococcales cyanobacterium]
MIELRHIRYFIAVAEELHFGRAAERLHIAQPGLSQQIQAMEEELGVRLLERTRRRVELTTAGQTFLLEGRRALAEVERAINLTRRAGQGEVGSLRIGAADSAVLDILPNLLREYRKRHPHVDLLIRELPSPDQITALEAGELDIGFVRAPNKAQKMTALVIREEEVGVYLPEGHPLCTKRFVKLESLAGEPLVLHPASRPSWADFMISICRSHGFEPVVGHVANETTAALSLVAAGMGITFVPATLVELARPGIVYKPIAPPAPITQLQLVHRAGNPPATVTNMVNLARQIYAL